LLLLPSLVLGFEQNIFLLKERWHLLNPNNTEHVRDTNERSFHSLTTLLSTLFMKESGDWQVMNLRRHITEISMQSLWILINAVRVAFVILALLLFRKNKGEQGRGIRRFYELSFVLLMAPLLFPHQQHYAFFFLFPAIAYLLYFYALKYSPVDSAKNITKKVLASVLIVIFFLLNSRLLLGQFSNYYDHFKTLTYGALLIVGMMAYCKPQKLGAILAD
jgi:hypothetical protein